MTRRWGLLAGTAVFLAIALVLASVALKRSADTGAELEERQDAMANLSTELSSVIDRLERLAVDKASLDSRVRALETELVNQPDMARIAKTALRSVFTVSTDRTKGSGFVLSAGRDRAQVVTNFHVVADTYLNGGREVDVKRGRLSYTGRIIDVSESNDLALIRVDSALPALAISRSRPSIGDPVLVLGSPLGLGGTVTSGIVSAFRTEEGVDVMQFSAPISPGNSGGPVVDLEGQVVGVTVAKFVGGGAEGLGFAIPSRSLCRGLDVC